jgi:hypothetical protein
MGTVCVHRKAMSDRNQGYRLSGLVEANQGYEGGEEHGAGRRGSGKPCVLLKGAATMSIHKISDGVFLVRWREGGRDKSL